MVIFHSYVSLPEGTLWETYKKLWKITIFLMGKSTTVWLVVDLTYPSEKSWSEFVSWEYDIPIYYGK